MDWIDLREPGHTLFLRAPLSKAAGGTQRCQGTVYADGTDKDYQSVRDLVAAAVKKAWQFPRRDLQSVAAAP